jgi:hypothetical protein
VVRPRRGPNSSRHMTTATSSSVARRAARHRHPRALTTAGSRLT